VHQLALYGLIDDLQLRPALDAARRRRRLGRSWWWVSTKRAVGVSPRRSAASIKRLTGRMT